MSFAEGEVPGAAPRTVPVVIGLVGGIGSGKTEVAGLIARRGGVVIDADRIGHELLCEPAIKERVRQLWGDQVLDGSGEVDRRKLAAAVFAPEGEPGGPGIEALNEIVHPKLVRRVEEAVDQVGREARARWVVIDAALFLEWGLGDLCDHLVFVDAPEEARCRRAAQGRGWTMEEVTRRERRQLPLEVKRARADRVIENAGGRDALTRAVDELLATLGGPDTTDDGGKNQSLV